ncbi:MAG: hypothetical protein GY719_35985 [bacterium]|nr:hypothetical protein [bacterium]
MMERAGNRFGAGKIAWAVIVAVLATAQGAAAQGPEQVPPTFEYNLTNPGARSMGFAGAFAALADDATAAFANPAGLVQLVEPEVSIEGRSWSLSTPYVAGGRFSGQPLGTGLDDTAGVRLERSTADLDGLSFLSFAYPRRRWAVAVYQHQLASFEFAGELHGLYGEVAPGFGVRRDLDHRQVSDLEIVSHAVAGGYRVTDTLSVGLAVVHFDGRLSGLTEAFAPAPCGVDPPCPPEVLSGFFDPWPMTPEFLLASYHVQSDATDWGLTVGVLWSFAEGWKLGGFLREAPVFDLDYEIRSGPALGGAPTGTVTASWSTPTGFPDVYGLGLSYRTPGQRFTVAFEWDRVEYMDFTGRPEVAGLMIEDGDELRLGAELLPSVKRPILSLRAGVWLDPDHSFRYVGGSDKARALLPPGEDEWHFAAGLGVAFDQVQVDLGVDLSDQVDTVSLSAVYGF